MKKTIDMNRFPEPIEGEEKQVRQWERYVFFIADKYSYLPVPFEDVVQWGMIGLLYAIRYYDPATGVPMRKLVQLCVRTYIIRCYKTTRMRKGNGWGLVDYSVDYGVEVPDIPEEVEEVDYWEGLGEVQLDAVFLSGKDFRELHPGESYMKIRNEIVRRMGGKIRRRPTVQ